MLTIQDATPLMAADSVVSAAAIKIIVAGGSSLPEKHQARASGVHRNTWVRRREEILALVERLES